MKASKLPPLPRVVNKLVVLGRHIGTYSHCDQFDTSSFTFYDFIPVSDFNGSLLEQSSISIEFELGEIKSYNDDGQIVHMMDLIDAVKDCPVYKEK